MGWDGVGWDGMGWDGMGWGGMGWGGMGGGRTLQHIYLLKGPLYLGSSPCVLILTVHKELLMFFTLILNDRLSPSHYGVCV